MAARRVKMIEVVMTFILVDMADDSIDGIVLRMVDLE